MTSTPGGNVPSDPALAACISIPIAVKAGMDPNPAIALAIPFGVIGVFLDQLRRTLNAARCIWRINTRKRQTWRASCVAPFFTRHCWGWCCASRWSLPLTTLADVVESFLKLMPHWLTHSFEIMGGILPALGFAITIMVIGKRACCRGLSAGSSRCYTSRSTSWRWPSSAPVSPS